MRTRLVSTPVPVMPSTFLWRSALGSIWLATQTSYSVCLIASGQDGFAVGEQSPNPPRATAWEKRLTPNESVVLQND